MKKLNLTDKRKFKPWIYKIVTNTSLEILKNNKNVIKTDYDVKVRLEILKNRMDDLLSNI